MILVPIILAFFFGCISLYKMGYRPRTPWTFAVGGISMGCFLTFIVQAIISAFTK